MALIVLYTDPGKILSIFASYILLGLIFISSKLSVQETAVPNAMAVQIDIIVFFINVFV
jgi:hypothetical protein